MKILIVEDNGILRNSLKEGFRFNGYEVDATGLGKEGIQKSQINKYDLIILDLNLPDIDGVEICKNIRRTNPDVPVLALTARDSLNDKLRGFENGFDDYLTKSFELEELMARAKALIKRGKPVKNEKFTVGNLEIIPIERKVSEDGKDIKLSKIEFNILEFLLRHRGMVVKNEDLIENIWNEEKDLLDPPIRSHIKNLRRKIGDDKFTLIQTLPGVGYKIS